MPRSSMQKQKLLYLQKIMLEKTDEAHGLTVVQLEEELARYGIAASRKALYDDLKILEENGLDVCSTRTKTVKYYVGSRDFEIPELKLLVDAIQSSKFITRKKSLSLIKKLGKLVSENEAKQLVRQVYVSTRVKNVNERIYYNVDKIYAAISGDKQISFIYYMWQVDFGGDLDKRIVRVPRKNGERYCVSPWALCWDDENYYLVAYDSTADMIKHYRVDKMEDIIVTEAARDGDRQFEKFDIVRYTKGVFSMFGGEETEITLSVDNSLVGVIADRFGSDVFISRESDESFRVNIRVMLSDQFYAWLFGLGNKVKIISPKTAINGFKNKISHIYDIYM